MTTAAPARAPTPRPAKATPTSSVNSEPAAAFSTRPAPSSSGSGMLVPPTHAAPRRAARPSSAEPLSDRTTQMLIRKILCPQQLDKGRSTPAPIEELLPPLTSRNDVDLQLYALIAIIIRDFVQSWYHKVTPDENFVDEIVQIIAHCTRALEQRLRKVDLESLLYDEIPDLLDRHITARRAATSPIARPPLEVDPREVYHSLCPLPALTPVPIAGSTQSVAEQSANEAAYRQLLIQGVLAVLLPTEDLENECLTALVGQIFSELIVGNLLANKVSEPWLIWEGLIILSRVIRRKESDSMLAQGPGPSGQAKGGPVLPKPRTEAPLQRLFLSFLHWCFLATAVFRALVIAAVTSRSLPSRAQQSIGHHDKLPHHEKGTDGTSPVPLRETTQAQPVKQPVLVFRLWSALSNLIQLHERMPWVSGGLALFQWLAMTGPGRIADVDGIIDRLLSDSIHRYTLDPAQLAPLLRSVRGALFPNNAQGSPSLVAPSSDVELQALRRRCASAIWAMVPSRGVVRRMYFGSRRRASAGAASVSSSSVTLSPTAGAAAPAESPLSANAAAAVTGGENTDGPLRSGPANGGQAAAATATTASTHHSSIGASASTGSSSNSSSSNSRNSSRRNLQDQESKDTGSATRSAAAQSTGSRLEKQAPAPSPIGRNDSHRTPQKASASRGSPSSRAPPGQGHMGQGDEAAADDEERILSEIEAGILDVFGDAYCNKHLIYAILELVLVRLMPELAEKGVVELWEERLS